RAERAVRGAPRCDPGMIGNRDAAELRGRAVLLGAQRRRELGALSRVAHSGERDDADERIGKLLEDLRGDAKTGHGCTAVSRRRLLSRPAVYNTLRQRCTSRGCTVE